MPQEKPEKKGSYEEGRSHLAKVNGIAIRLNRFPEGVNATKVANLQLINSKWAEGLQTLRAKLTDVKVAMKSAIEKHGNVPSGLASGADGFIDQFSNQFNSYSFELIVMRLQEGAELKAWKEKGVSQIRDIQSLLNSMTGKMILKNPFVPIDFAAFEKLLKTIEKSILLYSGN